MLEVLLGALIAFVGSTAGALIIERLNLRRRLRIELYEKYLPQVDEKIDTPELHGVLHEIRRASQLLGPTEVKHSEELWARYHRRERDFESGPASAYDDEERKEQYSGLTFEISEQVHIFESYLADKLKGWGRR